VTNHPHRLAITPGEPAGIGPDLCVQLAQQDLDMAIIAIGSAELLAARAEQLKLPLNILPLDDLAAAEQWSTPHRGAYLPVVDVPLAAPVVCGQLNVANAAYVLQTLDIAVQGCQCGAFDALVTGPVHKGIINQAGIAFSGHTEYLAEHSAGHPVMMLATEGLRVALVTTHLPLKAVPAAITRERLTDVLQVLLEDLQFKLGISTPRILVCGLNPHAGEDGHLGREEVEVINPLLQEFRDQGHDVQGPFSADTLFTEDNLQRADAVLAMYHDQGLPVLKHMGFGEAVNITLGLPFIRTSVDHGTALELAGSGRARVDSLRYALQVADDMVSHVQSRQTMSVA
jgi:4-hydroxythreonine-4-phosphate dehydrogenase